VELLPSPIATTAGVVVALAGDGVGGPGTEMACVPVDSTTRATSQSPLDEHETPVSELDALSGAPAGSSIATARPQAPPTSPVAIAVLRSVVVGS